MNRVVYILFIFVIIIIVMQYTMDYRRTMLRSRENSFNVNSGIVVPTTLQFDMFLIIDFILVYNPESDRLESLFLSGLRENWTWSSAECYFLQSNVSQTCIIDRRLQDPSVTCPLPVLEQRAMLEGRKYIFVNFTIHHSKGKNSSEVRSSVISVPLYQRKHYNLSIYTMIRNKKHQLVEWIEYHRMLGVEHFYIYDHYSSDNIEVFLRSYIDRDIVTIIRWYYNPLPKRHWNTVQSASMNHMLKNFGPFNRWVGYFDVDEYFFITSTYLRLLLDGNFSLPNLFDQDFPESKYPGGIQFFNCPMSCGIDQEDLAVSRYSLLIEKCQLIRGSEDCKFRTKMFIRPLAVPLMQNIHTLELVRFADYNKTRHFGRFQHYHYGSIVQKTYDTVFNDAESKELLRRVRKRILTYW